MIMNELLEKALRIAVEAHAGQVDKAGKPYIFHPLRVCARCFTDEERLVALLHDIIEDTEITAEDVDRLNRYIRVYRYLCGLP